MCFIYRNVQTIFGSANNTEEHKYFSQLKLFSSKVKCIIHIFLFMKAMIYYMNFFLFHAKNMLHISIVMNNS